MEAAEAFPVSAVEAPPSLPDASHRNVVLALNAVRTVEKGTKITDEWLRSNHRIGQDKQCSRLLRFLHLVDGRKSPKPDLLSRRDDWEEFRQLLVERVRQGCSKIGIEPSGVAVFGSGSWDAFQNALMRCSALTSRSARSRTNVVACFRALADVCEMDEKSFAAEVAKVSSATSASQTSVVRRNDAGSVVMTDQECAFPIGRQDRGRMVYARITFTESMQPGDLRRIADILRAMDVPMQASGEPE